MSAKTRWRNEKKNVPACYALNATLGLNKGWDFLELIYDWATHSHPPIDPRGLPDAVLTQFMQFERANFLSKRNHVGLLLQRARAANLSAQLAVKTRPEGQWYVAGGTDVGRALERRKAVFWICHGCHDDTKLKEIKKVRAILKKYIPNDDTHWRADPPLGGSSELIKKVHKAVYHNPPAYRFGYLAGNPGYPSSVGGATLLEYIFQITSNLRWPALGNIKWQDSALFYLGAIVAVQGFTDGNKRAARIAYSIILIKNGHPFIAPTTAYETELFNMHGAAAH